MVKAAALKTAGGASSPWVRILLLRLKSSSRLRPRRSLHVGVMIIESHFPIIFLFTDSFIAAL